MAKVRFFEVQRDGARREITDLYWFEENGVHSLDETGVDGARVELIVEQPRCDRCRFFVAVNANYGECPDGAGLSPAPSFGCVQFESKPSDQS